MIAEEIDTCQDALPNRNARNNDHELREPVELVQFEQRPQVNIRLAGASLHLNREVEAVQRLTHLDTVALLYGAKLGQSRGLERILVGWDGIRDTELAEPELA